MIEWSRVPAGTMVSIREKIHGTVSYKKREFSHFQYGLVFVRESEIIVTSYRQEECRLDKHEDFLKYRVDYETYKSMQVKPKQHQTESNSKQTTIEEIASSIAELVEKKNADYNNSFEERFNEYGWLAFNIRISDKLSRLKNLTTGNKEIQVKDESVKDTIKDIVGYSLLMLELLERKELENVK